MCVCCVTEKTGLNDTETSNKEKAGSILKEMGLSPAVAIEIFYRQIIFQKKMPFEIKSGGSHILPSKDEAP